jgi:hypothetical protein
MHAGISKKIAVHGCLIMEKGMQECSTPMTDMQGCNTTMTEMQECPAKTEMHGCIIRKTTMHGGVNMTTKMQGNTMNIKCCKKSIKVSQNKETNKRKKKNAWEEDLSLRLGQMIEQIRQIWYDSDNPPKSVQEPRQEEVNEVPIHLPTLCLDVPFDVQNFHSHLLSNHLLLLEFLHLLIVPFSFFKFPND